MKELYTTLPIGEENAIPLEQIAERWNVTERQARRLMEKMIYHDMPVCNLRHGYFRPKTVDELIAYRNTMRSYLCKFGKKLYRINKSIETFNNVSMNV